MPTRGVAIRAWASQVNNPQSSESKFPSDFTLFELGTWDDQNSQFEQHPTPISLGLAQEYLKNEYTPPQPAFSPNEIQNLKKHHNYADPNSLPKTNLEKVPTQQ